MKKYKEIRKDIKTGDILLFSGKGVVSNLIKKVTHSKYSHVGMCLKLRDYDTVFVWESTTQCNLKNLDGRRKYKRGVQMNLLSDKLRKYDGQIYWRQLKGFTFDEIKLFEFRQKLKNRPYEESKIELLNSAIDRLDRIGVFLNEEDLSSIFCSELISETYQNQGLLDEPPKGKPSNEYTQKDFGEEVKLKLNYGAYLEKTIQIT